MALQTSTGQVRLSINTGFDQASLTVNWMTFRPGNWRELNPQRVWSSIVEIGSNTFDLAIRERQQVPLAQPYSDEQGNLITHEEQEVITGYLPQSMETAHELLRNLTGRDCNFRTVNWQIV
jgi:hypothetical protein